MITEDILILIDLGPDTQGTLVFLLSLYSEITSSLVFQEIIQYQGSKLSFLHEKYSLVQVILLFLLMLMSMLIWL